MKSTYSYRIIKSSWGIAINITADVLPLADGERTATKIRQGLWLSVDPGLGLKLSQQEHQMLAAGLRLIGEGMAEIVQRDGPLVIQIDDISFNPTDYQEEGLAYALASWVAHHFNLSLALPPVHFFKQENRYTFNLEPQPKENVRSA
jgi:hypothetical protein